MLLFSRLIQVDYGVIVKSVVKLSKLLLAFLG